MKSIREAGELKDKKVLMRVDFDVPILRQGFGGQAGVITEAFRIEKQKETLDYLVSQGARVALVGHISAVKTFADLIPQLHIILGQEISFVKELEDLELAMHDYAGPVLLDNIRKWEGEEKNDPNFAQQLASHFDIYVNNAFAVSHRSHASVVGVAGLLPAYSGFQLEEEISNLQKGIEAPAEGKIVIMGGAKAETKIPVIRNLIDKCDAVLIGGVIANDFLKALGQDVGQSRVDADLEKILQGIDLQNSKIFLPEDFVTVQGRHLDVGQRTVDKFCEKIKLAKTVIWNGPMGLFEDENFRNGTTKIAEAIHEVPLSIVGGGDTIAAIHHLGFMNKFSFISTGGGAMLEYLAGNKLPGLEALK